MTTKEMIKEIMCIVLDINDVKEQKIDYITLCHTLSKENLQLQQENKQLKEMFEDSKTYSKEFLYKHNKNLLEANEKLLEENKHLKNDNAVMKAGLIQIRDEQLDLYKEVIKEARGKVKELQEKYFRMCVAGSNNDCIELLEILDKVKDDNNEK